jgi:U3 small nucleolar ribonucleoprotein protein IMP3|mmetsp:Transcript_24833/g.41493  ORF Transcript_24833/g.41493 Transcript_24833/m.41493 type:complete len:183 (+) Transcript_24833:199-747(+)|eukprot:CAMPEP_0198206662 /NCGR_PEP_ID=MMETSP1445-20131203/10203_1 /TAXON_ID=36898 /ORGANISM="Pyramimonas sp., Strain CCMP2087" /LENGTH=182 /DNA_ID=CAMNT_0043879439 /DNA_START=183 /DNA_END=731 /DNA_ORIENTATION=+
MRILKHHEKKLLKKVDFLEWKSENGAREVQVMRRYHVQDRDDYKKYNKLCGMVTRLVSVLKKMDSRDPVRVALTEQLLQKLYALSVVPTKKSLALCNKLSVSSFCRRRLAVVMVRLKMAETLRESVTFIEQGHVRVGPETVTDPAFLVTRSFEDFVTWVDTSKIKRKVMKYNDKLDDYDLLN